MFQTRMTELFGIRHPIILAGMNQVTDPNIVATVSNAGGPGVLAVSGFTLDETRKYINEIKALTDVLCPVSDRAGGYMRVKIRPPAVFSVTRTGGFCGKVLERLGVVAQNIPPGEVYTALEKGTIDAGEFVGLYDDQKLGFYKVAPNYYYPGWWEGSVQTPLYVNIKAYEALPADYKAMIEAAASHAHVEMLAKYDARNPAALKQLVAVGAKLHRFPRDVMEASFKESMALYSDLSAKNPNWKKVYEDYAKFRADEIMWFRFAEASFDNFMQAQKL